jgi:DNA-binding transcriptional MerR regulator
LPDPRILQVEAHFKSRGSDARQRRTAGDRRALAPHSNGNSALRYYERIGLLPPAQRAGGRRRYRASSAERVALIRLYQDAGFTLAEIRQLLAAHGRRRENWRRLAERKVDELDARIAEAQRAKNLLEHALHCSHRDLLTCPNFRAALHAKLGVVPPSTPEQPPDRASMGRIRDW